MQNGDGQPALNPIMKTRILLLCLALLPLLLTSCASGEYQLKPSEREELPPYRTWNYLPDNS